MRNIIIIKLISEITAQIVFIFVMDYTVFYLTLKVLNQIVQFLLLT